MLGRAQDFPVALRWLDWLLARRGPDPELHAVVGSVQLMMGDIAGAEESLRSAQAANATGLLVRRSRSLLMFAQGNYAGERLTRKLQRMPRQGLFQMSIVVLLSLHVACSLPPPV